jgi:hypothetical protein
MNKKKAKKFLKDERRLYKVINKFRKIEEKSCIRYLKYKQKADDLDASIFIEVSLE